MRRQGGILYHAQRLSLLKVPVEGPVSQSQGHAPVFDFQPVVHFRGPQLDILLVVRPCHDYITRFLQYFSSVRANGHSPGQRAQINIGCTQQ